MVQGIVLLVGILVCFLRGGKLQPLPKFHFTWLLLISFSLELISIPFFEFAPLLASLSYVTTILFLVKNWSYIELRILLIGVSLNALVIWVNGGIMPVAHVVAKVPLRHLSILQYNLFWHGTLTHATIFPMLSDIIYVPFPKPTFMSCGDVFIFMGTFLLIQKLLGKPIRLAKLAGLES